MGRHSAPDDGDDGRRAAVVVQGPPRPGRHARLEEAEPPAPAPGLEVIEQALVSDAAPAPVRAGVPPPVPPSAPPRPAAPKRPSGTASDLALLRAHPDVRARCIAGALSPFVFYAAALAAIGQLDVFLIWVWTPLILAGVLIGLFLDLGHKRYSTGA
jgi:hypothetical protein